MMDREKVEERRREKREGRRDLLDELFEDWLFLQGDESGHE
jgi:acetyl-CoA carboxylase alpha subunit